MIVLDVSLFENLGDKEKLLEVLQVALELEHATIPPYLFAAYTLKGANSSIAEFIIDVAHEEMLHMTLVCNLINALGGSPRLNSPDFIPKYPSRLPGAVQNDLVVPLAPFSKQLLKDIFMCIEEPEDPAKFPVLLSEEDAARTIGQFYRGIKGILEKSDNSIFSGDPERQLDTIIDDDESLKIVDKATAIRAIDLIVDQGEGTKQAPLELASPEKEAAHYYRFEQILHGRTLVQDSGVPEGFSYSGEEIPFDESGVWPVKANPKIADMPPDSAARRLAEQFSRDYVAMLDDLHRAFNGEKERMDSAIRLMRLSLRSTALQLVKTPLSAGVNAGPTFEFVSLN